ncbi:MAG: 30S ribosomal protein S4 [Candidatus Micrarchaeota archaeon]|nr:30S ribosomal protein S4 [Candidatus Micrarchaeota archaeon]
MGDPRKIGKKYKKPKKLLDKTRVIEEGKLNREYGLKNTRELWKAQSELRKVRREARKLLALGEEERKKGAEIVLNKLERLGILSKETATIDNVLSLTVRNFLDRRLQSLVYKKGLAKKINQARQLITHGFISVDGRKATSPGMLIIKSMEDKLAYYKPIDISVPEKKEAAPAAEAGATEAATAEAAGAEAPKEEEAPKEAVKEGES